MAFLALKGRQQCGSQPGAAWTCMVSLHLRTLTPSCDQDPREAADMGYGAQVLKPRSHF
jgi:hypothetical protein